MYGVFIGKNMFFFLVLVFHRNFNEKILEYMVFRRENISMQKCMIPYKIQWCFYRCFIENGVFIDKIYKFSDLRT